MFLVDFDDCKDANEYLIKHGKEKLKETIGRARAYPLENVTTFKDIEGDVKDFVTNGFKPGFQVGLENFDRIFSTYTGPSLLLLLAYLVVVSLILWIKWS